MLGIMVLYTAIIDPYRIAFVHALEDDLCRSFSVFDGFDIFIDIVFILNIAVQVGALSFFFWLGWNTDYRLSNIYTLKIINMMFISI